MQRSKGGLAEPIAWEIEDADDLAKVPAALDVVATRLARHRRWAREPDVDTEPLDSLLARAIAVVPKAARKHFRDVPENVSMLASLAEKIRYSQTSKTNIRRAEGLRGELYDHLLELEEYLR